MMNNEKDNLIQAKLDEMSSVKPNISVIYEARAMASQPKKRVTFWRKYLKTRYVSAVAVIAVIIVTLVTTSPLMVKGNQPEEEIHYPVNNQPNEPRIAESDIGTYCDLNDYPYFYGEDVQYKSQEQMPVIQSDSQSVTAFSASVDGKQVEYTLYKSDFPEITGEPITAKQLNTLPTLTAIQQVETIYAKVSTDITLYCKGAEPPIVLTVYDAKLDEALAILERLLTR